MKRGGMASFALLLFLSCFIISPISAQTATALRLSFPSFLSLLSSLSNYLPHIAHLHFHSLNHSYTHSRGLHSQFIHDHGTCPVGLCTKTYLRMHCVEYFLITISQNFHSFSFLFFLSFLFSFPLSRSFPPFPCPFYYPFHFLSLIILLVV